MGQVCTNDFTTLGMNGIRHAVMCNEKGQILTDGVVIRIGEDRYRTYWLDPVISYYVNTSDLDVHGENMSGKEYFIQIDGEKSLEILENAFQANLHDIKFGRHRIQEVNGKQVRIIRLGMSGNLAYEIHGDMADYAEIYNLVWAAGEKLGARKLGLQAYNMFNHTEAGFPNINLHYPLPWLETSEKMTEYMRTVPQLSMFNLNRRLLGSVGDDLQARFVTPYDVGWDFLIKYNHDFIGKEALLEMSKKPQKKCVTLEWNAEDVAEVFAMSRSVANEAHLYEEFIRFRELADGILFSEITPKSQVLVCIADHFADRFPLENWVIYDKTHKMFLLHRKQAEWALVTGTPLNRRTADRISESEKTYSELWKEFFESISISERENPVYQRTHLPLRYRNDMTEFSDQT